MDSGGGSRLESFKLGVYRGVFVGQVGFWLFIFSVYGLESEGIGSSAVTAVFFVKWGRYRGGSYWIRFEETE